MMPVRVGVASISNFSILLEVDCILGSVCSYGRNSAQIMFPGTITKRQNFSILKKMKRKTKNDPKFITMKLMAATGT